LREWSILKVTGKGREVIPEAVINNSQYLPKFINKYIVLVNWMKTKQDIFKYIHATKKNHGETFEMASVVVQDRNYLNGRNFSLQTLEAIKGNKMVFNSEKKVLTTQNYINCGVILLEFNGNQGILLFYY
jgi:midasin (ATPase involved in ribosome maturation)